MKAKVGQIWQFWNEREIKCGPIYTHLIIKQRFEGKIVVNEHVCLITGCYVGHYSHETVSPGYKWELL